MAYIDREELESYLQEHIDECPKTGLRNPTGYGVRLGLRMAIAYVKTIPAKDVVPRNEVELLQAENERLMREKTALECVVSTARNQAKQEVAREMLNDLDKIKHRYYIGAYGVIETLDEITEAIKKYIGE